MLVSFFKEMNSKGMYLSLKKSFLVLCCSCLPENFKLDSFTLWSCTMPLNSLLSSAMKRDQLKLETIPGI